MTTMKTMDELRRYVEESGDVHMRRLFELGEEFLRDMDMSEEQRVYMIHQAIERIMSGEPLRERVYNIQPPTLP